MAHLTYTGVKNGTIVYIHGNSSSVDIFQTILNSDQIEYTQIAIPLRGHRYNLDGDEHDFSIISQSKMILSEIEKIDEPILLAGNSLGGHLALEVAGEIKNLAGLIIFGTPPLKNPLNLEEAFLPCPELATYFNADYTADELERAISVVTFNNRKHEEILMKDFTITNPEIRTALTNDVAEDNFKNEYEIFRKLEVPKYILLGLDDPTPNPDYLYELCKSTKNCKIYEIEECGHYPSIEQPQRFIEIIKEISNHVFNV